jgi:hypothetical protein
MIRKITPQVATTAKHRQRVCLMVVLSVFSMVGSGCELEQKPTKLNDIAGKIIVDIAGPRRAHDMFLVLPHQGTVTRFTGSTKTEPRETRSSTGAIESCHSNPTSVSPDQRLVAGCQGEAVALLSGSPPDEFILRGKGEKTIIYQHVLGPQISGIQWSPDSHAVAVLTCTVHVSWNPRYWLEALNGHPSQYETYDLHVIDVVNFNVASFSVPFEASLSTGRIVSWGMSP